MIQVDVFWAFAMGAHFATCAGPALAKLESTVENKYFAFTVCFMAMVFAPSGTYLLNRFPGWETMFVYNKDSFGAKHWMCALIPTAFTCTNTLLGIAGFAVAHSLMKAGKRSIAVFLWTTSYVIMFSILGFGYGRFFYSGSAEDWAAGKEYHLLDFFSSEVWHTLAVMGVFVGPPLLVPSFKWQTHIPEATLREDRKIVLATMLSSFVVMGVGYQGYLAYYGEKEVNRILTGTGVRCLHEHITGVQSPLTMAYIMNIAAGAVFVLPPLMVRGQTAMKTE